MNNEVQEWQDPMQMVVAEYEARLEAYRYQIAEVTDELGQKQEYILRLEAKNDSNAIVAAYRKGYSAANAALTQRVAESWQPVEGDAFVTPDTEDSAIWVSGGNVLCICIDGVEACITLPNGLRLCQHTTAQDSTTTTQEVEGNE